MHRYLVIGAVLLGMAGASQAVTYNNVPIEALQEVPVPTLGGATPSGTANVTVNTLAGGVNVSASYTGMTSNVIATHVHGSADPARFRQRIYRTCSTG